MNIHDEIALEILKLGHSEATNQQEQKQKEEMFQFAESVRKFISKFNKTSYEFTHYELHEMLVLEKNLTWVIDNCLLPNKEKVRNK